MVVVDAEGRFLPHLPGAFYPGIFSGKRRCVFFDPVVEPLREELRIVSSTEYQRNPLAMPVGLLISNGYL